MAAETPRMPSTSTAVVPATGALTPQYLALVDTLVKAVVDLQARVKALGG